jgi:hypothetical protein
MATLRLGDGAARLRRLSPARQAFLLLRTVLALALSRLAVADGTHGAGLSRAAGTRGRRAR